MSSSQGVPLQQQHMYAQFVVDGFWVDLHISKTQYKAEEHVLFLDRVKSIKFEAKSKTGVGTEDSPMETARKAAQIWLLLWDAGKHDEVHESASKQSIHSRRDWYGHPFDRSPLKSLSTANTGRKRQRASRTHHHTSIKGMLSSRPVERFAQWR